MKVSAVQVRKVFLIFLLLQLADLGTTVAVMMLGGNEQNPLVQRLMAFGSIQGVVLAKLLAVALGLVCLISHKHRALRLANLFFAGIVVWNLAILVVLIA